MTRINSAISPKNLIDQHLIAELRELPRIFTAVRERIEKEIGFNDIPKEFCLGSGHVKFFYNKYKFLFDRYSHLRFEYLLRFGKLYDFDVTRCLVSWEVFNDYKPTENERQLLIERISTRIMESKQIPRYYGEKITKERAIEILKS